jgi:conjugal transfer pilus assembly protein TraF
MLLWAAPAIAETIVPGQAWLGRGREGWFWYQDPPPSVEAAPIEIPPPDAPESPVASVPPVAPPSEPAVLSAAWFRANLSRYKDEAIDNPTPQNVERFLALQHIMMDRATAFTDAFQRVVASSPYLDANTQRPIDSVGANAANEIASAATDALLRKLSANVGLVFFFQSDCALCAAQFEVLEGAQRLYGFTILYVSLDGKPMPDMPIPAWAPNVGQAQRIGVTAAPALALLRPPDQFAVLAKSVLSLPTLAERVLLQSRGAGWISDAEYEHTRPLNDRTLLESTTGLTDEMVADPEKFLAFIHAQKGAQP